MPESPMRNFERSFEVLAELGLSESRAQGYAIVEHDLTTGESIQLAAGGEAFDWRAQNQAGRTVASYMLAGQRTRGIVIFAFDNEDRASKAKVYLDRVVHAIQMIWSAASSDGHSDLINRVVSLEARLMDLKIAERARGLLTNSVESDITEAIVRHVEGILRPRPTHAKRTLERLASELEEDIESRKLASQAKQILQGSRGLSEEQAHAQLRRASRKSRKPLKEIALEVLRK